MEKTWATKKYPDCFGSSKWNVISLYFSLLACGKGKIYGCYRDLQLTYQANFELLIFVHWDLESSPQEISWWEFMNRGCSMGNLWQIERWVSFAWKTAPLVWWCVVSSNSGPIQSEICFMTFKLKSVKYVMHMTHLVFGVLFWVFGVFEGAKCHYIWLHVVDTAAILKEVLSYHWWLIL